MDLEVIGEAVRSLQIVAGKIMQVTSTVHAKEANEELLIVEIAEVLIMGMLNALLDFAKPVASVDTTHGIETVRIMND